jgi:hypothetical protein
MGGKGQNSVHCCIFYPFVPVLSFLHLPNHNEFEVQILCLSDSISFTPAQILNFFSKPLNQFLKKSFHVST